MNELTTTNRVWWRYLVYLLHVLGLGLWLGTLVFFPFCVALPVINGMQALARQPDNWLHLQSEKAGIRLAGEFLDIVFSRYFVFQLGCGLVALLTAAAWCRQPGLIHRARAALLVVAVLLVACNEWWLAAEVRYWRQQRYLNQAPATASESPEAVRHISDNRATTTSSAEAAFQFWHNLSLAADLVTLVLVFSATLLAPLVPTSGRTAVKGLLPAS